MIMSFKAHTQQQVKKSSMIWFVFVRPLTYSCVSDKSLLVGHDGVDGHLLEVLRRDDGDGRMEAAALTEAEAARHLLHHRDVVLVEVVNAPECHRGWVCV